MEYSKINEGMISVSSVSSKTYSLNDLLAQKKRLEAQLDDTQGKLDNVNLLISEAAKLGVVEKSKDKEKVTEAL